MYVCLYLCSATFRNTGSEQEHTGFMHLSACLKLESSVLAPQFQSFKESVNSLLVIASQQLRLHLSHSNANIKRIWWRFFQCLSHHRPRKLKCGTFCSALNVDARRVIVLKKNLLIFHYFFPLLFGDYLVSLSFKNCTHVTSINESHFPHSSQVFG